MHSEHRRPQIAPRSRFLALRLLHFVLHGITDHTAANHASHGRQRLAATTADVVAEQATDHGAGTDAHIVRLGWRLCLHGLLLAHRFAVAIVIIVDRRLRDLRMVYAFVYHWRWFRGNLCDYRCSDRRWHWRRQGRCAGRCHGGHIGWHS